MVSYPFHAIQKTICKYEHVACDMKFLPVKKFFHGYWILSAWFHSKHFVLKMHYTNQAQVIELKVSVVKLR